MKYYAGLDVSLKENSICVVDTDGRTVARVGCRSGMTARQSHPCCIRKKMMTPAHIPLTVFWRFANKTKSPVLIEIISLKQSPEQNCWAYR